MRLYYILLYIPFLFINCNKPQPEVSWVIIEKFELLENPNASNEQGEMTHNVNQGFVSMGGRYIGTFELPIKIPIIAEGNQSFTIIPGVIRNGINATKTRYPFMQNFSADIELKLNDTVILQPTTMYSNNVTFLIEDFENPAINIETDEVSKAQLVRSDDPTVEKWGNFFGRIDLNDEDSLYIGYTIFGQSLPAFGADVYLEMDYMNTNSLLTSVISFGPNMFEDDIHIQLNPRSTPEWRHIYIDLKEIISARQNASVNEMGFSAVLDQLGTEKYIYLDNIKIVF